MTFQREERGKNGHIQNKWRWKKRYPESVSALQRETCSIFLIMLYAKNMRVRVGHTFVSGIEVKVTENGVEDVA